MVLVLIFLDDPPLQRNWRGMIIIDIKGYLEYPGIDIFSDELGTQYHLSAGLPGEALFLAAHSNSSSAAITQPWQPDELMPGIRRVPSGVSRLPLQHRTAVPGVNSSAVPNFPRA